MKVTMIPQRDGSGAIAHYYHEYASKEIDHNGKRYVVQKHWDQWRWEGSIAVFLIKKDALLKEIRTWWSTDPSIEGKISEEFLRAERLFETGQFETLIKEATS